MALGESRYKGLHVPYRDSKLTSLLQQTLGGNSITVMIACVSPSDLSYEENLSTLEYASRAKNITNHVFANEDPKSRLIRQLKAENAFLKDQLARMKVSKTQSERPKMGNVLVNDPSERPKGECSC
eukprot:5351892-Pyramimonas_sp.AAC.1